MISQEEQDILNKLIDNSLDYPRFEVKIKTNNNIIHSFITSSQDSAHLIATILLKVPERTSATITFFKNAYNSEIKELIKNEKSNKHS